MNDTSPLPHEQTLELLRKARHGDVEAQEYLVVHNTALVKSIVKKFLGRGVEFDDIFQIGCLGLVKAIKNYDEAYNVRFSTYAVPMIAGEIKRYLRDDGMIKVSRSLKELSAKVAAMQEILSKQYGREPGIHEVAKAIDAEPEEVVMALESARPCQSIDEPLFDDGTDTSMADRLSAETTQEGTLINRVLLKELLTQLEPRERQLIMLRYFQDKTQGEIAKILGVSQVQISRLETRIIQKLRKAAK
ncbi:MAG: SigF/SigG family RNA polymerase sporulation sigma factor [Bacillota bacterium]